MKRIIDKLSKGEEVEYGFLGISQSGNELDSWRPTPGGPAAFAGMRDGDVIKSVDGLPINRNDDLLFAISVALAGTEVEMVVETDRRRRVLHPRLAKTNWRSSDPVIAANRPAPVHGLRVEYTSVLFEGASPRDADIPPGVLVREVTDGSPAAKADLRPEKECVVEINGQPVNSPKEFYDAVHRAKGAIELTLCDAVPPHGNVRKVKLP
jgi:serine protease Do